MAVYDDGIAQDVMDPEDVASTEELVMDPEVDYMGDEDVIMCHVCDGVGSMRLDYNYPDETCSTCQGYGMIPRNEVNHETDEPFVLDPDTDYTDDKYYMDQNYGSTEGMDYMDDKKGKPKYEPSTEPIKPSIEPPKNQKRKQFTPPDYIEPRTPRT